jgi:hypothetical protein
MKSNMPPVFVCKGDKVSVSGEWLFYAKTQMGLPVDDKEFAIHFLEKAMPPKSINRLLAVTDAWDREHGTEYTKLVQKRMSILDEKVEEYATPEEQKVFNEFLKDQTNEEKIRKADIVAHEIMKRNEPQLLELMQYA